MLGSFFSSKCVVLSPCGSINEKYQIYIELFKINPLGSLNNHFWRNKLINNRVHLILETLCIEKRFEKGFVDWVWGGVMWNLWLLKLKRIVLCQLITEYLIQLLFHANIKLFISFWSLARSALNARFHGKAY